MYGLEAAPYDDLEANARYQLAVTGAMHAFIGHEFSLNPLGAGVSLVATIFDEVCNCPTCGCPLASVFSNGSRLCSNCGATLRWGFR